jgi:hypothetical protein
MVKKKNQIIIKDIISLELTEKDIIHIKDKDDLFDLGRRLFSDPITIFNLKGVLYLIGDSVAYIHRLDTNGC